MGVVFDGEAPAVGKEGVELKSFRLMAWIHCDGKCLNYKGEYRGGYKGGIGEGIRESIGGY